ncbi:phage minor head protein [Methylobacterium sp. NPDC080182]|uniref:phage head morphogenesis protein n=1 Tax=Methylobacterium sp. NPDC080182 TaxID=3390590 RepID=UPI003D0439C2
MDRSVGYWLKAAYRKNAPEMAQDELPAETLRRAIRALTRRWQAKFNDLAGDLAAYFAQSVSQRSDAALKAALKKGGFTVEWTMTRAQRDVVNSVVHENVSLIKSIAQQHLSKVEGIVMRSVATGRDLGQLTKDLQEQFGVTKRRAQFIAQSQNQMATAALTRARQLEIGVTEAVWVHSSGGKKPRRSHVTNNGKTYDVNKGWYDPDEKVWTFPGVLPRCRCVSKAVIPGFG